MYRAAKFNCSQLMDIQKFKSTRACWHDQRILLKALQIPIKWSQIKNLMDFDIDFKQFSFIDWF